MTQTLRKTGKLWTVPVAILIACLLIGKAPAEQESAFERMLKEAVQSNLKKAENPARDQAAFHHPLAGEKETNRNENSDLKEERRDTKNNSAFKVNQSGKTSPQPVNAGWTTVVPNDGRQSAPSVQVVRHDLWSAGTPSGTNAPDAFPLIVADKRMVPAGKETTPRPEATLWDEIPENIGTDGATASEKGAPNQEAASPWDADVSSEKNLADTSVDKTDSKNNTPDKPEKDAPKEEISEEMPENDTEISQEGAKELKTGDDSDKKENAEETRESEDENVSAEDGKKTEKAGEVAESEKKATDEKKQEEASSNDSMEGDASPSGKDMTSKLQAVERENQEETAKKMDRDVDAEKAADGKKTDAVGDSELHEGKEVEPKKLNVVMPGTEKKADAVVSQGENTEVSDEEPEKAVARTPIYQSLPDFDDDEEEESPKQKIIDGSKVGDVHAKDKIKLMYDEIVNGMKSRNVSGRYEMWKNYARNTLRGTAGLNTGSEVDGRCRLSWYAKQFSEPIFSVFDVEEFSRLLHHGLSGNHRYLAEGMGVIREKLDIAARNDEGIRFPYCETPFDAINEVKRCLLEAQMAHARALSTLSTVEQNELAGNLVSTFSGQGCVNGHTIPNRTYGRRLVNMMNKMDKTAIHDAAEALIPLTNLGLLALLDKLPEDAFPTTMLNGQKVQRLATSAGDIIIGGRDNNVYDLDSPEMRDVVCVIDLGGDDLYREGTCNIHRPVFVTIDLHGNDTYTGSKPGIQGGSILGISMLVDVEGDDTYTAGDMAQGSSIGGVGLLFDFAGNDTYKGLRRVQGHALCGAGLLVDRKGHDKYRAALWAQGFGAPGGFGVLNDVEGNDQYYCGGLYLDSYPEHPGYDGWGQGVGAGIRQVANGGIGAILDGSGDDSYEVDYFGHGGGYWLGLGFARDFGGNDIRHGTTLTAYNGGPRQQNKWTRFANGFGCHYALGYLFDDAGNDVYGGTIMGTGMAWDLSIGYLCDFNGSDRFTATGGMTQGVGAEGSIGILFSYGGNDTYLGRNQAYASSGISYHSPSNCGANFSFLINYGGTDTYGCGAKNNSYVQRGSATGFLIDRPTDREAEHETAALRKRIEEREQEIAEFNAQQEKLREEATAKGRRYYPPRRRPMPISADQQRQIGSVPHFGAASTKTGGNDVTVK